MNRLIRHPARLLAFSFATTILVGAALLALPLASTGSPLTFLDALFMATSAVCVTGLAVVDPGSALSGFGQAVLLGLVQIGGLGIMTLSSTVLLLIGQDISLSSSDAVQDSFFASHRLDLGTLLRLVFLWTLTIEAQGAVVLFLTESQRLPFTQAIWGKFSLTAGKRESIKIILPIFQYVSKARWATYLHLMSNYDLGFGISRGHRFLQCRLRAASR